MKRTQIYLDEEIYRYLKEESKKTGKSMSEIIREKIKSQINQSKENIINSIDEVAGIWKDRSFDTDDYIRTLRKGNRIDNI